MEKFCAVFFSSHGSDRSIDLTAYTPEKTVLHNTNEIEKYTSESHP